MKRLLGKVFFEEDDFNTEYGAVLTVDDDTFHLELIEKAYRTKNYRIIQGEFLELGFVTLINCRYSGSETSVIRVTKYNVQHIITEIKFNCYDRIVAERLKVRMPVLKEWVNKSSVVGSLITKKKIEYSGIEKVLIYEDDTYLIDVVFYLNENWNIHHGIKISEYCVLDVKSKMGAIHIFDLLKIYKKVKLFISFLGYFHSESDEFEVVEENIIYDNQDGEIRMKLYTSHFNTANKGILSHEKISFDAIQSDLNTIFKNWISNKDIQDSIMLVMEKYTFVKLTVETYFLNTCFAIETYHRNNKFNKNYSKADFKRIKNGIQNKLETQEEIDLFNDKLSYANEPSFKKRLISLKSEFSVIIDGNIDIDDYIKKIVSTRNYLVHRGSKNNVFEGSELYYAAVYLETLTKFCIMENIGINQDVLNNSYNKTSNKIKEFYEFNENNKFV